MTFFKKQTLNLSSMTLAACLLTGTGSAFAEGEGDHGHETDAKQHWAYPELGEPGIAEDVSRTITITMYDNYFEPEELDMVAGETVRFVVINEGQLVHEFNLASAEMHARHQDEMMMMIDHGILESDNINEDMMSMTMANGETMHHNHANSVLLEPGDTAEVIWTFSGDAELEFACNVPGHYDAGMMGEIEIGSGG
jgi:uncharacterized cupredoxin-like copper-binding protein